ncbi:MAG: Pvc16 family protein, partial [Dehalococcoidia bacterium]
RRVSTGASVFLYRAVPNLSHRTPAGRLLPDGSRQFTRFPLDAHIIVTVWGDDPVMQNRLVGWVFRTLEDYPVIPASVLNIVEDTPIFEDEEAVELMVSDMGGEELLQLWEMLGNGDSHYQICIPYLARNIRIDSRRLTEASEPVQVRTSDMRRFDGARS